MKAVLLIGGLGTRLRSAVPTAPKALAPVGGRPFLELIVQQLVRQGIRELVMCTGYLAEQIEEHFGDGRAFGVSIEYSFEPSPLGTAGALKLAEKYLACESDFLVLNGDSFFDCDFAELIAYHRRQASEVTFAVALVSDASRYGTIRLANDGRILAFLEKAGQSAPGLINAGVYVMRADVLGRIAEGPSSLEKDIFPGLLKQGMYGVVRDGLFIDIGTPSDYARANQIKTLLAARARNAGRVA